MQASEQVVEAAGGAWCASLNHYALGDGRLVTTQQVDEWVFAVGLSDFAVSKHPLSEWIGEAELNPDRTRIPCDDARMAWAVRQQDDHLPTQRRPSMRSSLPLSTILWARSGACHPR